jgi:acyl dehydratase
MNVESILRSKGRFVATIGPNETVGAAVRLLSARDIGARIRGAPRTARASTASSPSATSSTRSPAWAASC